jgi:hypothetical protein
LAVGLTFLFAGLAVGGFFGYRRYRALRVVDERRVRLLDQGETL